MIDEQIAKVRAWLKQPGAKKSRLAREAKVHRNSIVGIDDPHWNPRARTLRDLAAAVDRMPPADTGTPPHRA